MNKAKCEPIRLTLHNIQRVHSLIDAVINDYDITVKQVKTEYGYFHYEIELQEKESDSKLNEK